jgi:cyclic lactone autoinducer peptide
MESVTDSHNSILTYFWTGIIAYNCERRVTMKKIVNLIRKHSLSMLALFALFVGTTSASAATMVLFQQVKCPEELLK